MKHAIQLIFISACCGLFIGAENAEASRAGIFSFPEIQCSFSGIDIRDAHNRSVAVDTAMEEMAALFRGGLYEAVVNRDAPSIIAAQAALQKIIKRAEAWFLPGVRRVRETVSAVAQTIRRFLDRVLLPLTQVGGAGGGPARITHPLESINRTILPLVFPLMRC